MSEYVLEMTGVCKSFPGVKALDHAQLKLHPGKVHALMGENGAGKSTLMKCMFGIYKMDEGQIKIDGQPVTIQDPMDALKKGIAMVHQELQPIPARTVGENIFLGRYPMKKFLGFIPMIDHDKMYADTAELLKKEQRRYEQDRQIHEAINVKCHDIRHQIAALGDQAYRGELKKIEKMMDVYDTELHTHNSALDVILSGKMLACMNQKITFTCMADGRRIGFMEDCDIYALFGNILDNVICILFAYWTNRTFVFKSQNTGKAAWAEFGQFVSCRIATMVMDQVIIWAGVSLLGPHVGFAVANAKLWAMGVKLFSQVIVILSNYVFSKVLIFKKK